MKAFLKRLLWLIGFEDHGWLSEKEVREFFMLRSMEFMQQEQQDLQNWISQNRNKLESIGWRVTPQLRVVSSSIGKFKHAG